MLKYLFLFIFIVLNSEISFAQKDYNYADKYLIVDVDNLESNSIGYNFCKTRTLKGKEIYVLNSRYKVRKNQRSWVGSDSDFMFTFYVIPKNDKIQLEEIKNIDTILTNRVKDFVSLSESLSRAGYSDLFTFSPIVKIKSKYFKFVNCSVQGQAFNILEDPQYFPKYGAGSNKYELNLLAKPYNRAQIDSLRILTVKDSTAMIPFFADVEDFYDKWYINKIDKKSQTIDFWIQLKRISTGLYSFGRVTTAIVYKVNKGVIGFKIKPDKPEFSEDYLDSAYSPVEFNFVEFVDLKKLLPSK